MVNITALLIILFFAIIYFQSGYEKITEWKKNVELLKEHFAKSFFKHIIPFFLFILTILELICSALSIVGIVEVYNGITSHYALYAAVTSAIILLILLIGERIAKDYDGARTIVIYFIPTIIAIYILQYS